MLLDYTVSESPSKIYSLTCKNNSNDPYIFYMFQKMPTQPNEVLSLAWLTSPYKIATNSYVTFKWSIDYNFIWGNTGTLANGEIYDAGGSCSCSPTGDNITTFNVIEGAPLFTTPIGGGEDGTLTILLGENIPPNMFSIGIGMSGQGTVVQMALPNIKLSYSLTPEYYVAVSSQIISAEVLDCTDDNVCLVKFPENIYSLTATLNSDNSWSIS